MANLSYGYARTAVSDAAAGAAAWGTASNAAASDNTYATADLGAVDTTTEYLKLTNVEWDRAVPATATVVGVVVMLEGDGGQTDTPLTEAKLVIGGTITGTSQHASAVNPSLGGSEAGRLQQAHNTFIGGHAELWGTTPTVAEVNASGFGVAVRFDGQGATRTPRVDAVKVYVYWTDTVSCVATAISPLTGKMAPYAFHAHALDSVWGTQRPEEVAIKWTVTTYPVGWSQTCVDPRPGDSVSGATRDCATDIVGWNAAWLFDVAGTYKVKATMYTNDSGTGAVVTTDSTELTVVVDANTRTVRYYDPSASGANDGTSWSDAWQTFGAAGTGVTALGSDVELVCADDQTEANPTASFDGMTQLWIRRSGLGTNRPSFTRTTGGACVGFGGVTTDIVVDGLDFTGDAANASSFYNSGTSKVTRVSIVNVVADDVFSFVAPLESGDPEQFLVMNSTCTQVRFYGLYFSGNRSNYVVSLGVTMSNDSTMTGEGTYRFTNGSDPTLGRCATVCWSSCDLGAVGATGAGAYRMFWAYQTLYQSLVIDGDVPNGQNADTTQPTLQIVSRYDGVWFDNGSKISGGSGKSCHSLWVNCRLFDQNDYYSYGVIHNLTFRHNWFTAKGTDLGAPHSGNLPLRITHSGVKAAGDKVRVYGNFWVGSGTPGTNWNSKYIANETGNAAITESAYNLYARNQASTLTNAWQTSTGTHADLTAWNALAAVHDEAQDLTILYSDMVSAGDYAVPDSFDELIADPDTTGTGVFWDYRGITRDYDAALWKAGMTGAETGAPAPPSGTTTYHLGNGLFVVT